MSWDLPQLATQSHACLGRSPPGIQHSWGTEAVARHKVVIRQGFHGPSWQGQMISLQVGEFDKFGLELY
jgi:hypothetical protein